MATKQHFGTTGLSTFMGPRLREISDGSTVPLQYSRLEAAPTRLTPYFCNNMSDT
jgi:hypothetical protein